MGGGSFHGVWIEKGWEEGEKKEKRGGRGRREVEDGERGEGRRGGRKRKGRSEGGRVKDMILSLIMNKLLTIYPIFF